jgi:hypothetical protein
MNKALAALVLLALASPAFADDDLIFVPSLTTVPFVLNNTGDMVSGYIQNWGSLSQENGNFSAAGDRAATVLQKNKCAIHFGVVKNSTGRIDPKDGTAAIACMRRDGETLIETVVPGTLVDSTGTLGLKNVDVGTQAFFLVQTAVRIPLADE